jgi:4-hydroxybenzoate polyprenyltransferase
MRPPERQTTSGDGADALTPSAAARTVSIPALLKLGRVSNLPTVWTNVVAGTALAGGDLGSARVGAVLLGASLLYEGGMFLNDYFDRHIDARERPGRPIPAGEVSATMVATVGFGLLGAGVLLIAALGMAPAVSALALAAVIVAYDYHHKGNPAAALVMGLCRGLVYACSAAAAVRTIPAAVGLAALAMVAYVAGLTYAARQENFDRVGNLWPLLVLSAPLLLGVTALGQGVLGGCIYVGLVATMVYAIWLLARRPFPGAVPRAVGWLIAGISLVDAVFLAGIGAILPALVAAAGFAATLLLQRYVAGT